MVFEGDLGVGSCLPHLHILRTGGARLALMMCTLLVSSLKWPLCAVLMQRKVLSLVSLGASWKFLGGRRLASKSRVRFFYVACLVHLVFVVPVR